MGPSIADSDRAAILELLAVQTAAWNRGDLDAFLAGYEPSEDIVFTAGGLVVRGFGATRERYRKHFGGTAAAGLGRLRLDVLALQALGADGAMVLGRFVLEGGGAPSSGIFSLGLVRGPAGFRIVHDHTTAT